MLLLLVGIVGYPGNSDSWLSSCCFQARQCSREVLNSRTRCIAANLCPLFPPFHVTPQPTRTSRNGSIWQAADRTQMLTSGDLNDRKHIGTRRNDTAEQASRC